jgi:hypothetical protein
MQTYPTFCTLTKNWISHRGNLYHTGTTFKRIQNSKYPDGSNQPGDWYEFKTPETLPLPYAPSFGIVYIPHTVFLKFTEERKVLEELRKKEREDHFNRGDPLAQLSFLQSI